MKVKTNLKAGQGLVEFNITQSNFNTNETTQSNSVTLGGGGGGNG
jgi:hypothetical protein